MTFGQLLGQVLIGDAALAALVEDRVYSEVLPQRPTLPAVVFDVVAGDSDHTLEGPSGARTLRVRIDAKAKTRAEATSTKLALVALLDGYTGGAQGLSIDGAFLVSEAWDFDPETKEYTSTVDFEFALSGVES